ncbi:MATE efflux family protein [Pseudarthrobacter chlorophenolicus A6]|uniref:Probable multidrug resistance protein NorM n=1 Tax=Pseudarthrobacter chlorophenolicus (strain ATCC 700700 / DSM 12829 / CIP 107037 / JCM 12360 / KCTC 9906 / NCIMB 13794 / A6) TaxID=452863 RepID=B8H830_PSECP|nr:MATE family efflux transporter [Pseudarthrobacter chlorophenolicus]ACL41833.1 MATE efflux family protein [Pseudarthrobacter chlorophenolicus A6]SDQ57733.1 putative efflux protein, MATE family [Pseudarthrobacter chlorophenolicus]
MSQPSTSAPVASRRGNAREILRLAVPAFGALVAEPLFLLADSAIVGHLGVAQLAGVGLASAVLHTVVGLMVFLAYSTTPAVARAIGDGQLGKALAAGRDGVWLALLLGVVLAVAGFVAAEPLIGLMGAEGEVRAFAVDYLRWSMPGLVAMLLVFAGTGVLRGLQDTRTPLVVATAGFGLNIVLNLWLVYGLNWSVTGSAVGTSVAQWGMAAVYVLMVRRNALRHGVSLLPSWHGIRSMTRVGSWLMLRTLSLRAAILVTVLVVTGQGAINLAAHQLAMTIFSFLAFALDALAIAAQALIGKELGASNAAKARLLTTTMIRWGIGFGVVTGLLLAVVAPWAGALFTPDRDVQAALAVALWILAAGQPIAGYVFVLDGVLIGAGDARYLALAGVANVAAYAPMLAAVAFSGAAGAAGLAWLWAAFSIGYMAARAVTLGLRARSDRWMVLGSA